MLNNDFLKVEAVAVIFVSLKYRPVPGREPTFKKIHVEFSNSNICYKEIFKGNIVYGMWGELSRHIFFS